MKKRLVKDFLVGVTAVVAVVWGLWAGAACAESDAGGPPPSGQGSESGGPGGRRPPPEAYKACEGKMEGTTAQMTTPRGDTITGVCETKDGKLVLIPDFMKKGTGNR